MLRMVRIHNVVWLRTPWVLIHGYECCGGAFWVFLNRLSTDGGNMSWLDPQDPPFILHFLITLTTVINFNILHFPCIVSLPCLLQMHQIHVFDDIHSWLLYICWSEQNIWAKITYTNMVCCLINVLDCFVIISKFVFFKKPVMNRRVGR